MDNFLFHVVNYFQNYQEYFWKWADNGRVIEWRNGSTLCYREELMTILQALAPDGLPPLSSILLAVAATKRNWRATADHAMMLQRSLDVIAFHHPGKVNTESYRELLSEAFEHMDRIHTLDDECISTSKLPAAMAVIFQGVDKKMAGGDAVKLIEEFRSGRLDPYIFKDGVQRAVDAFKWDFSSFNTALQRFTSGYDLELAIRTGIQRIPESIPLEIPAPVPAGLLQELAADHRTSGLANLTQHIIAALHIPLQTHGSSDQLVGGVSDISNRGNFDRLLLSELAYDDQTLLVRLANNEALYLRREEIPEDPPHEQYILIDTTIKMWGLPRVYAIAVALACSEHKKKGSRVRAFALGGDRFTEVDLQSKSGIIGAMEQQDAGLHCTDAMVQLMQLHDIDPEGEFILITGVSQLHHSALMQALVNQQQSLSVLFAIDRSGVLQSFQFINRHRKLIQEIRLDVQDFLSARKKTVKPQPAGALPAMFYCEPFPLYFPSSKLKFSHGWIYEVERDGVFAVTLDRRVLYWNSREHGAQELLDNLPEGHWHFGLLHRYQGYLLLAPAVDTSLILYQFHFEENNSKVKRLELPVTRDGFFDIYHEEHYFHVRTASGHYSINADTGEKQDLASFHFVRPKPVTIDINNLRRIVNNGYSVLNKVERVYINQDNALSIDNRQLRFVSSSVLKFLYNREDATQQKVPINAEPEAVIPYPNCGFKLWRFRWGNGSNIFVDTRGLMHLQSPGKDLPDISIVLAIEKATACWASDGSICGPTYFTGKAGNIPLSTQEFYVTYIQKFIDQLW